MLHKNSASSWNKRRSSVATSYRWLFSYTDSLKINHKQMMHVSIRSGFKSLWMKFLLPWLLELMLILNVHSVIENDVFSYSTIENFDHRFQSKISHLSCAKRNYSTFYSLQIDKIWMNSFSALHYDLFDCFIPMNPINRCRCKTFCLHVPFTESPLHAHFDRSLTTSQKVQIVVKNKFSEKSAPYRS